MFNLPPTDVLVCSLPHLDEVIRCPQPVHKSVKLPRKWLSYLDLDDIRARRQVRRRLRAALEQSRAGGGAAPQMWSRAMEGKYLTAHRPRAKEMLQKALNAPVKRGGMTLIEEALKVADADSLQRIAGYLPNGVYAGGRAFKTDAWIGEAKEGLAHGRVVGFDDLWLTFVGRYHKGVPHGKCRYQLSWYATFDTEYDRGQRCVDSTYAADDGARKVLLRGPWIGSGKDAVPQDVSCQMLNVYAIGHNMRAFDGRISVDASQAGPRRFANVLDGVFTFVDGDEFSGRLEIEPYGLPHGQGTYLRKNHTERDQRDCATGRWKDGVMTSGLGRVIAADGTRYEGDLDDWNPA